MTVGASQMTMSIPAPAAVLTERSSKAVRAFRELQEENISSPSQESHGEIFQQFEEMFVKQAVESMLPEGKSGWFGGGAGTAVWRSMLADGIAAVLARSGVTGVAAPLDKAIAAGEETAR